MKHPSVVNKTMDGPDPGAQACVCESTQGNGSVRFNGIVSPTFLLDVNLVFLRLKEHCGISVYL